MITREEYHLRLEKLREQIIARQLDGFLVTAEESIYYLTGVSYHPLERPFFILATPKGAPLLLVPALEREHLMAAPNIDIIHTYWDYPSPPGEGWADKLAELTGDLKQLGVEPSAPQEICQAITTEWQALPLIEELRLVKSPAEVAMLRQSARYADLAIEKVLDVSYYGVSELELYAQGREVQMQMIKDIDYDVLTCAALVGSWPAPLSAEPHGVPTVADRLYGGPHISLALMRVNGYASECERTYFLDTPDSDKKAAFAAMREARKRAFEKVRPGCPCAEVDAAAMDFLKEEGYGQYLLHRTGHGFGLGNHEGPWVAEGSTDVLAENMLISIEPGIYIPKVGGFRHSDTVLVTSDGYESLTQLPCDIESMTIRSYKPLKRLRGKIVSALMGLNNKKSPLAAKNLPPGYTI